MTTPRPIPRLVFAGGLALTIAAAVALAWGVGAYQRGRRSLPDADGSRLEWLVDPGARMTFAEILARPNEDWRPWDGLHYLRAASKEAQWLRVTLHNPGAEPLRAVLQDTEYYVDAVDAWIAKDERAGDPAFARGSGAPGKPFQPEGWRHEVSGESMSARERPWWTFTSAFIVEVPASEARVVYLRGVDYYGPYSRWQWWPRLEDYFSAQLREALVKALCLGALLALCLYNVGLWLRLHFRDVGCYVGYAAAMTLFNFTANGGLALVGGLVRPAWKIVVEVGSSEVSILFLIAFARLFLDTANRMPRLDRGLRWLFGGWIAALMGAMTMPWLWQEFWLTVMIAGLAITHVLLLGTAILAWARGLRPARFFVAAFGALSAGGLPAAVTWGSGADIHPMALGLLASSTLEMLLLSFAVADRFATTQQRLAEETEHRRMLQETYADELAVEVSERTRELKLANADKDRILTVIGHDLRGPLTGLMRSAEKITGDFSQEVSRTGRTLLLLIEDLVLWARLRAGTRTNAEFEASALARPVIAQHRTLAEHAGIDLIVSVPEELLIQTDLVLAQTLLRNLVGNALKFADSRVVVSAESVADGVRFTVGNDGPALSADVARRFTTFTDEPITATGGLGLRLCREICEALETRLEATADAENATIFSFTLREAPALKAT